MKKSKLSLIAIAMAVVSVVSGCSSDATVVTENIKKDAEQFKVIRRIVFMNNITGEYLFEAEGNCSVETNNTANRLELTCKVGEDKYKIIFKPESILPFEFDVE